MEKKNSILFNLANELTTRFLTNGVGNVINSIDIHGKNNSDLFNTQRFSEIIFKDNTYSDEKKFQSGNEGKVSNYNNNNEFDIQNKVNFAVELVYSEEYIEGETSKTVIFFESLYANNKKIFIEVFQRVWLVLYAESEFNLYKYISMTASLNYEWLRDRADALILGACSHSDHNVNEAALRAVESWGQKKHLQYLQKMKEFDIDWLESYKLSVINYLELKS